MSHNTAKKKVVRWVLIGIVFVVISGVGVILTVVNNTQQKLADFMAEHPEESAVVTYSFDANGIMIDDGNAIFHNADEPLIVASMMKTVVLAAYADMVASGELDPNELVPVADWERYYLPISDGGAHEIGLQSLGLETDALGFAADQTATVTLDALATIMMHYSGNASTDYLIDRMGMERLTAFTATYLPDHTPINYTLGYALAVFNHEAPYSAEWLQQVTANVERGDDSDLARLIDLYLHDETWRQAQIDFVTNASNVQTASADAWAYQTTAAHLLAKGTARGYAQMMAQIGSGTFISQQVSDIMRQKLESVPSDGVLRALYFDRFGAKDGMTAGVISVASYAEPKWSGLRHQSRVVVLVVNGLPLAQFATQAQYQGHYLLPIDLAQGGGAFSTIAALSTDRVQR